MRADVADGLAVVPACVCPADFGDPIRRRGQRCHSVRADSQQRGDDHQSKAHDNLINILD